MPSSSMTGGSKSGSRLAATALASRPATTSELTCTRTGVGSCFFSLGVNVPHKAALLQLHASEVRFAFRVPLHACVSSFGVVSAYAPHTAHHMTVPLRMTWCVVLHPFLALALLSRAFLAHFLAAFPPHA